MNQRARRRITRHPNVGFVPIRHFLRVGFGAGRAARTLAHWHRIAKLDPDQRITMEIGRWEGFRFITSPKV